MSKSLQDQLLNAGLVNKNQAKKVDTRRSGSEEPEGFTPEGGGFRKTSRSTG